MRRLTALLLCATIMCSAADGAHALRVRAPLPALSASDVPALIEKLKSANVETQSSALDDLQRVAPIEAAKDAVPSLIAITRQAKDLTGNWRHIYLQTQVIAMLGRLPLTPETTDLLFSTADIRFSPEECRKQYEQQPGVLPPPNNSTCSNYLQISSSAAFYLPVEERYIGRIKQALKHPTPQIRNAIVGSFRRMQGLTPAAAEILQSVVMNDSDSFVRTTAAQVIAEKGKGDPSFAPALIAAIKKENGIFNKLFYVTALAETGGASAGELDLFMSLLSSSENDSTRYNSAKIIGQIGAKAADAVPNLIDTMNKDSNQLARGYAAQALGKIGPPAREAIPSLIAMLEDRKKPNYRYMAAEALGAIATKENGPATQALIHALSDQESETQKQALLGLQRQHNNSLEVQEALKQLKVEENSANASLYQDTLKNLTGTPATLIKPQSEEDMLYSQLNDVDEAVQHRALLKLKRLPNVPARFVPGLIKALSAKDVLNNWYACDVLGIVGTDAREAALPVMSWIKLQMLANTSNIGYCTAALAKIAPQDKAVLTFLSDSLQEGRIFFSDGFSDALAMTGDAGVPYLINGLASENLYSVYLAAAGLARTTGNAKAALPVLLSTLKQPEKLGIFTTQGYKTSERIIAAMKHIAPDSPELAEALELEKTLPPPTNR